MRVRERGRVMGILEVSLFSLQIGVVGVTVGSPVISPGLPTVSLGPPSLEVLKVVPSLGVGALATWAVQVKVFQSVWGTFMALMVRLTIRKAERERMMPRTEAVMMLLA